MSKRKRVGGNTRPRKRRRFVRRKRKSYIPYGLLPAYKKVVRLKYRDTVKLSPTIPNVPSKSYFSCCSIYDPDRTGTGHQPKGMDQLAAYYSHYTVIGSKIHIKMYDQYTTSMLVFIVPTRDTSPAYLGNVSEVLEADRCQYRLIGNSKQNTRGITSTYSKRKIFGNTTNEQLTSNFTSNPGEDYYWCVGAINGSSGVTPVTVPIVVEIEYIVLCTERKTIVGS